MAVLQATYTIHTAVCITSPQARHAHQHHVGLTHRAIISPDDVLGRASCKGTFMSVHRNPSGSSSVRNSLSDMANGGPVVCVPIGNISVTAIGVGKDGTKEVEVCIRTQQHSIMKQSEEQSVQPQRNRAQSDCNVQRVCHTQCPTTHITKTHQARRLEPKAHTCVSPMHLAGSVVAHTERCSRR